MQSSDYMLEFCAALLTYAKQAANAPLPATPTLLDLIAAMAQQKAGNAIEWPDLMLSDVLVATAEWLKW